MGDPAKVCMTLGKRDHMHFDNADATVTATSQMIYGAVRWISAASLVQRKCPCARCSVGDFGSRGRVSSL